MTTSEIRAVGRLKTHSWLLQSAPANAEHDWTMCGSAGCHLKIKLRTAISLLSRLNAMSQAQNLELRELEQIILDEDESQGVAFEEPPAPAIGFHTIGHGVIVQPKKAGAAIGMSLNLLPPRWAPAVDPVFETPPSKRSSSPSDTELSLNTFYFLVINFFIYLQPPKLIQLNCCSG